jgi:hypothetical protein
MQRLVMVMMALVLLASPAMARSVGGDKAAWLSVAHPGLGEYYNAGWGSFFANCPQRKFWLGLIPLYGWPGYLQVLSAIDAYHGRTSDNLRPIDDAPAPRHHTSTRTR